MFSRRNKKNYLWIILKYPLLSGALSKEKISFFPLTVDPFFNELHYSVTLNICGIKTSASCMQHMFNVPPKPERKFMPRLKVWKLKVVLEKLIFTVFSNGGQLGYSI